MGGGRGGGSLLGVGTWAAIYISKPRRRILPPHSGCLFWGVTFWQREKLFQTE